VSRDIDGDGWVVYQARRMMRTNQKAFTTTELVILLALLAFVLLLVVPALNVHRKKQYRALCARNLQMIGAGMYAYMADNGGHLPTVDKNRHGLWDVSLVLGRYVAGETVFRCPADRMDRVPGLPRSYSYSICVEPGHGWIEGMRLPSRYFPEPANVALVIERVTVGNCFGEHNCNYSLSATNSVQSQHTVSRPTETRAPSNYLFMDGHVAWADVPQTNWFPTPPPTRP
jgi:prepilin-type processing-associated H-X9-DG protein